MKYKKREIDYLWWHVAIEPVRREESKVQNILLFSPPTLVRPAPCWNPYVTVSITSLSDKANSSNLKTEAASSSETSMHFQQNMM